LYSGIFCYAVKLDPSWYDSYVKYVGRMRVKECSKVKLKQKQTAFSIHLKTSVIPGMTETYLVSSPDAPEDDPHGMDSYLEGVLLPSAVGAL